MNSTNRNVYDGISPVAVTIKAGTSVSSELGINSSYGILTGFIAPSNWTTANLVFNGGFGSGYPTATITFSFTGNDIPYAQPNTTVMFSGSGTTGTMSYFTASSGTKTGIMTFVGPNTVLVNDTFTIVGNGYLNVTCTVTAITPLDVYYPLVDNTGTLLSYSAVAGKYTVFNNTQLYNFYGVRYLTVSSVGTSSATTPVNQSTDSTIILIFKKPVAL